jgi:hypothetical protein
MRVIESPADGAVVQAATDDELVKALVEHHEDVGEPLTEDEAQQLVEDKAYDATDS